MSPKITEDAIERIAIERNKQEHGPSSAAWSQNKIAIKREQVMSGKSITPNPNNFILYTSSDGTIKNGVIVQGERVCFNQKQSASLFSVQVPPLNKHLSNSIASGELHENAVVSNMETTANDRNNTILGPASNVQNMHDTQSITPAALFVSDFNKQINHLTSGIGKDDSTH